MFRIVFVLLLCALLFYQSGCSKKPSGFPDVYPCQITVLNGEQPEENVRILLYSTSGSGSLLIRGQTNSAGYAVFSTSLNKFSKQGVPKGEYTAVFEKIVDMKSSPAAENKNNEKKIKHQGEAGEVIGQALKRLELQKKALPAVLQKPATSPIKFEVKDETGVVINVNLKDY
jgi:hypothetical protein